MRRLITALAIGLSACSAMAPSSPIERGEVAPDVLLLGEQHDADAHSERHRRVVEALAARGRLAALAVEMAEQGRSTAGLPRDASEESAQAALAWDAAGWPWAVYRPAVMAAVRAGVPVLGANLPRSQLRSVMGDDRLDSAVSEAVMRVQRDAVAQGHCGLLPDSQLGPMARVQIARDQAMAKVLSAALVPGKTVVLVAGAAHVDEATGVPQHLPRSLAVASHRWPAEAAKRDYCADLKAQLKSQGPRP